jgi:hypothetical protein
VYEIVRIIPIILYFLVGLVCLVMAFKSMLARKFLPFHEQAAGKPWNNIEEPFRFLILAFLRLVGFGFLITAILLMVFPVVNYFFPDTFMRYSIPGVALIYCIGVFAANYLLHKDTKADTPWKGSLYAMVALIAGVIISIAVK